MNSPKYLAIGQDVLVVGHDGKPHRAKITQVITAHAARVESRDGKHSAVAEWSDKKEIGTFHFPPDEGDTQGAAVSKPPTKPAPAKASAAAEK
jgi:hypothetical protein